MEDAVDDKREQEGGRRSGFLIHFGNVKHQEREDRPPRRKRLGTIQLIQLKREAGRGKGGEKAQTRLPPRKLYSVCSFCLFQRIAVSHEKEEGGGHRGVDTKKGKKLYTTGFREILLFTARVFKSSRGGLSIGL